MSRNSSRSDSAFTASSVVVGGTRRTDNEWKRKGIELKYSADCPYSYSFEKLGEGATSIKDHSKIVYPAVPFDLRSGDGNLLLQLLMSPSERNCLHLPRIHRETPSAEELHDFSQISACVNGINEIFADLQALECRRCRS
ncbi:hypothetical protein Trydic_g12178 [Trypoxylus dichotomus]